MKMALQKLAHAVLRVQDLDAALAFNTEVFGLIELGRAGQTVYLGCGGDNNYDLGLVQGGTGVLDFGIQVESEDDLRYYARRLTELGVRSALESDREPGEQKALRFALP